MDIHSVRTAGPPGQDLVPDRMSLIGDWRTDDGVTLELYVDHAVYTGRLIAIPPEQHAVIAAYIAEIQTSCSVSWTGEIDRPQAWQNAQEAVARAKYARSRR